jgi:DNA replication protein DnaC
MEDARRTRWALRFKEAKNRGDLPAEFSSAGFVLSKEEFEKRNPEEWAFARAWSAEQNLYIQGPHGTGKTFLARCILSRCFVHGWNVAAISTRRLLKTADRFDEGKGDYARWCDTRLVLLDDIDKCEPTARRLESLWEFFDRRESAGLRTIVTSNLPINELGVYLQPRDASNSSLVSATLDRMKPVRVLEMTGESLRGIETKNEREKHE